MNALARDLSAAASVSKAMARDLFGYASLAPSAIACHTILSALDTGPGLSLMDSTWPAGAHVARHAHQGEDEILIVLSGTLEVRLGERALRLRAGETFFIPRGVEHEVRAFAQTRHIAILTRKSLEGPRPV